MSELIHRTFYSNGPSWDGLTATLAVGLLLIWLLGYVARRTLAARSESRARLGLALGLGVLGAVTATAIMFGPPGARIAVFALVGAAIVRIGLGLPAWSSGLSLFVSGRLRIGSGLRWKDGEGRLARVGLLRTRIETATGPVFVPWGDLGGAVATEGGRGAVARVVLELESSVEPVRAALEERLATCPYRIWSAPYRVQVLDGPRHRVELELRVWSENARPPAETWMLQAATRELTTAGAPPVE